LHLYNVRASIKDQQNAPLLLGQSAIEKLGKVTIDGHKLIIHKD
jgi:predicted aspartyl protease